MPITQQKYEQGVKQYNKPRLEDEINLTLLVRDILVESKVTQDALSAYDTNRFILESANKTTDVQRFLQNRFWTLQLMSATESSVEERYCLIPDGNIEDWIRFFKSNVLPFIIRNNLPQVI